MIEFATQELNRTIIDEFVNGDYGIKLLLNRIDEIAGSNSKYNRKARDKLICYG